MKYNLKILLIILFLFTSIPNKKLFSNSHDKINIAIWERAIDFYKGITPADDMIISNVCSGLIEASEIDNVTPKLSYYWIVNRNKTEYTFRLRKNAYFHSEKRLTAWDVKRFFENSIKENINPFFKNQLIFSGTENYIKGLKKDISGIVVKDDFTITFKLNRKEPMFFYYVGSAPSYIRFLDKESKIDCVGPYKIVKINKNGGIKEIHLEKENNYFNKNSKSPNFVKIEIKKISKEEVKNYDIAEISPELVLEKKRGAFKEYKLIQIPTLSTSYVTFGDGYWAKNINFRKFLFNLVDRESLFPKRKFVSCIFAKNILPYRFTFFKETPPIKQNYSIGFKALRKLSNEEKLNKPVVILATQYLDRIRRANILKKFLEKHGFKVELTILPHEEYMKNINTSKRKWDIAFIRLSPDTPDIYDYLFTYFKGTKKAVHPVVRDKDLNFLIDFFATETSYEDQLSTVSLIMKLIERKALIIPIYYHINFYLVKKDVKNISINPLFGLDLNSIQIKR